MKQIVLERTSVAAARPTLRHSGDGTVTLRRPNPTGPSRAIRCLSCAHLHSEEARLGFKRSSCSRGRFRSASGAFRCFSLHELQYPSRETASIANNCPDHQPADAEVPLWL